MVQKLQKRKESGFTIIEVLIVLAIAGLIMVVVFLAVPSLQRSQRNNSRKTDANNVLSSISSYIGNNAGALPTDTTSVQTAAGDAKLGYYGSTTIFYSATLPSINTTKGATGTATSVSTESMTYVPKAVCNGTSATLTGGSARSYALVYAVETSSSVLGQCIGS